ncbi:MAG: hypothetical protein H7Z40_03450 [Phycisphaerae bacterium]|nr:hypothetical protein [Gemmatimonadaceae bacterium]
MRQRTTNLNILRGVRVALASSLLVAGASVVAAQTATLAAPAAITATPVIPERLADSTFWRMITEFSEPSGYFTSENFVSNETAWQQVIPPLLASIKPGGVYLGVGPEQNFTYIVAFRPKIAFIVDIRRQNLLQHMWYKAVSEMSVDRADFLSRLFGRTRPAGLDTNATADALITAFERAPTDSVLFKRTFEEARDLLVRKHGFKLSDEDLTSLYHVDSAFYFAGTALNYSFGQGRGGNFGGGYGRMMPTFAELMRADDGTGLNRSFIGSEANYRVLRDMQQRNLIVPLVGNFAGDKALASVGNYVRARNATVSAFYLSNVEQYLFRQGDEWSRFYTNVSKLPLEPNSTFIRSATNRGGYSVPTGAGASRGGGLMVQLVASMQELVQAFKDGKVTQYGDVLNLSR